MLGLIRTIKTAALSVSSASTQFMPDTQTIAKLAELTENFSPDVKQAAESLDKIVESMTKSYLVDTVYFELLVQTFKGVLNNSQSTHLQYFYMIIPALTINFVENPHSEGQALQEEGCWHVLH
jgi:WASH complex subunit 7